MDHSCANEEWFSCDQVYFVYIGKAIFNVYVKRRNFRFSVSPGTSYVRLENKVPFDCLFC